MARFCLDFSRLHASPELKHHVMQCDFTGKNRRIWGIQAKDWDRGFLLGGPQNPRESENQRERERERE